MHRPPLPPGNVPGTHFYPRAMVRSEGNMSLKNPVTPLGIAPGTVRQEAQRFNHYATSGPFNPIAFFFICLTSVCHSTTNV
jgi:hypothetical protein